MSFSYHALERVIVTSTAKGSEGEHRGIVVSVDAKHISIIDVESGLQWDKVTKKQCKTMVRPVPKSDMGAFDKAVKESQVTYFAFE